MRLICGLGNVGSEYENTRHNVGFLVLDELSRRHNIQLSGKKFHGMTGMGEVLGEKALFTRPLTYMNRSGLTVGEAVHFYQIAPEDVIVIHDELDIPFGEIRIKKGGSTAGHNGLKSVTSAIGPEFYRIRVGVGDLNQNIRGADYVLGEWNKVEKHFLSQVVGAASDATEVLLKEGLQKAQNQFNKKIF